MAYGGYAPINYQNYQPNYQPNYQMQNPAGNNNPLIWVSGEAGAKAYLVAPNTTVALWDSERQTIYLKSADTSGMPTMKILDYSIRENEPVQRPLANEIIPSNSYATKDDLEALKKEVETKLDEITKQRIEA